MFAPLKANLMMLGALLGVLLTGCGQVGYGQVDQYGNPINGYGNGYDSGYGSGYGSGSYGSGSYGSGSYGSDYSSGYGSSYGSDYSSGGSYGSGYDSSYGSGSSYGSDYGSGYGSDTGYGTGYSQPGTATTNASPKPTTPSARPAPIATEERYKLSAWVIDVKETGFLGLGKVVAKVEIENPSDRRLSGKLSVRFTKNGDLTPHVQGRRVTLAPKEKQVITFTASSWRLNDAEATIETEDALATESTVKERTETP